MISDMKTENKKSRNILLFLSFFLFAAFSMQARDNSRVITISGIVKDQKTKKKIEYAGVSVPGTSIGTITNTDGEFTIKISDSLEVKEIEISHIGYSNYRFPVDGNNIENTTIFLSSNDRHLKEVVVQTMDPLLLVKNAIEKIEINYSDKPTLLTGFYRETIKKRRNYISIAEAVIDVYKTAYDDLSIDRDRARIYKGRQLMSIKPSDTLVVKFQGGPVLSNYADIVKNTDIMFDMETLHFYKFKMEEPVLIDERPHFTVSFEPQVDLSYALFEGKLYIDQQTLTFSRAEYNLDMDNRNKVTQAILRKKPYKLQFKPEKVAFLVNYKQRGGKTYLNYIRNEIQFKCDWSKRWIFSTGYTIVSEMVVTDTKEDNISNIPRKEEFKSNQFLSDKVESFYDKDFWGDYNIIEPTESLESAVNKLRKQYR